MLIIGNPTNIYLATSANIGFFDYFKVMVLPTLAAGLIEYGLLLLIFLKKLREPVELIHEEFHIKNKVALFVGLGHLLICLVFLIISNYIHAEMWLISCICAISLLIFALIMSLITKKDWGYLTGSLKKLPYPLIPFFLSMFVIVVALNYQGVSEKIMDLLSHTNTIVFYSPAYAITMHLYLLL